jgi:transcriptional regulator of aroF, aroG, tyrA and aromatic amino acid transport
MCDDRVGITQDVLDILVGYEIDLRGIEIDPSGKIYLHFPSIDFTDFQDLMPRIRRIPGIEDVRTAAALPIERERNQLGALLNTLPEPVFSVDAKGYILLVNEVTLSILGDQKDDIVGKHINDVVMGYNIQRWLDKTPAEPFHCKVKLQQQEYVSELLPVMVSGDRPEEVNLAGAVVLLKSEFRLGQQMNVLSDSDDDLFDTISINSQPMKKLVKEARRMAQLDAPMIIFGETGTGKELLANACHKASRRADKGFLVLNCASIPDNVAETELFGYGPGAFGSTESKSGLLEQAQGGTILLDEVGDMSFALQSKLLRLLQDGSFRRIGDEKEVTIDVRFICTTHKDLSQMVREKTFREDLYYRLNVFNLTVPALRDRKSDVLPLALLFIKKHAVRHGIPLPTLSKSCSEYVQKYPWPGNVRQLDNVIFRAMSLLDSNVLERQHLQLPAASSTINLFDEMTMGTLEQEVKRFEMNLLRSLYPSYPSTRQLAKKLGLSHTAIANKLREYGINKSDVKM